MKERRRDAAVSDVWQDKVSTASSTVCLFLFEILWLLILCEMRPALSPFTSVMLQNGYKELNTAHLQPRVVHV